jgi:hypothetical protein
VCGHEERAVFRRRVPGAAGGSAQRFAFGLAVPVAGASFHQVARDYRVHGGLLHGGKNGSPRAGERERAGQVGEVADGGVVAQPGADDGEAGVDLQGLAGGVAAVALIERVTGALGVALGHHYRGRGSPRVARAIRFFLTARVGAVDSRS